MSRAHYETPLLPVYPFNEPGSSITLYHGPVEGKWPNSRLGEIELTCQPGAEVRWRVDNEDEDLSTLDHEASVLRFERGGSEWSIKAHQRSSGVTSDKAFSEGWIDTATFERPNTTLNRVIVHWMNLPRIDGPIGLDYSGTSGGWCSSGRWRVEIEGWRLTLDIRRDYARAMENEKREHVYLLTHVMEILRADGGSFTVAEVEDLIECLRVSFSFAFGRWVAPVLPVGFDEIGEIAWERWISPICDRARSIGTAWLYKGNHDDLTELIARTIPAFANRSRPGMARYRMVLAVQAVEAGFVEQRILAAMPALEHLAWDNLVLGNKLSSGEYEDRFAEDRLRYLLREARISTDVDANTLPALAKYTQGNMDGPSAVTRIRNRLIHPKTQEDQIYRHDGLVEDVWRLTLHYVTLLILHSIAYQGSYQNPVNGGWAGNTEAVPWAGKDNYQPPIPPNKRAIRASNRTRRAAGGRGSRNRRR